MVEFDRAPPAEGGISATVPPSLQKIRVFLAHAQELDRDRRIGSRVVAYNARRYAVLIGTPLAAGKDDDAKIFLAELSNQLEKEREAMSIFGMDHKHWKVCRKVADQMFERADAEDRAGTATIATAKTFYAAGTNYEMLQLFYGPRKEPDDNDDDDETNGSKEEEGKRRVYCIWKAALILHAFNDAPIEARLEVDREPVAHSDLSSVGREADVFIEAGGSAPIDGAHSATDGGISSVGGETDVTIEACDLAPAKPHTERFSSYMRECGYSLRTGFAPASHHCVQPRESDASIEAGGSASTIIDGAPSADGGISSVGGETDVTIEAGGFAPAKHTERFSSYMRECGYSLSTGFAPALHVGVQLGESDASVEACGSAPTIIDGAPSADDDMYVTIEAGGLAPPKPRTGRFDSYDYLRECGYSLRASFSPAIF